MIRSPHSLASFVEKPTTQPIKANKRGTLIGQKTSGAAAVKRFVRNPDGTGKQVGLKQFYFDQETPITNAGVEPDILIQPDETEDELIKKAVLVFRDKQGPK